MERLPATNIEKPHFWQTTALNSLIIVLSRIAVLVGIICSELKGICFQT